MNYVIRWKSRLTPKGGCGTTLFTWAVACAIVARMDREFPDISHWVADPPKST